MKATTAFRTFKLLEGLEKDQSDQKGRGARGAPATRRTKFMMFMGLVFVVDLWQAVNVQARGLTLMMRHAIDRVLNLVCLDCGVWCVCPMSCVCAAQRMQATKAVSWTENRNPSARANIVSDLSGGRGIAQGTLQHCAERDENDDELASQSVSRVSTRPRDAHSD